MIKSGTTWVLAVAFLKMGTLGSVTEYSKVSLERQLQIFDDGAVSGARLEDYHQEGLSAAVDRNQGFEPRTRRRGEEKEFSEAPVPSHGALAFEKTSLPSLPHVVFSVPSCTPCSVCSGLSMRKPGAASGRNPISHHEDTKGTKKREGRKRSVTMIPPPCNQGRARLSLHPNFLCAFAPLRAKHQEGGLPSEIDCSTFRPDEPRAALGRNQKSFPTDKLR